MDPRSVHSRLAQFNHRQPHKKHDAHTSTLHSIPPMRPASSWSSTPKKPQQGSTRPIVSNSRVRRDEQNRRDLLLAYVDNALRQNLQGNTQPFDDLVCEFSPKPSSQDGSRDPAHIRLWLQTLSHVVSRLDRPHAALVQAIINISWTTMDPATVKAYTLFIGMLLSARPEYLSLVLNKIAQAFTYQSGLQAQSTNSPETCSTPVTRRIIYDRLHTLLRHVLTIIPTCPSTLRPILVRYFPHKSRNLVEQQTYIRNLLRISEYCDELSHHILSTIVEQALQIDVEIQVEMEELEESQATSDQDLFELDPFDVIIGQEGDLSEEEEDGNDDIDNMSDLSSEAGDLDDGSPEAQTAVKHIQEMVQKLDATLHLLFRHFQRNFAPIGPSNHPSQQQKPLTLQPLPPLPPLDSPISPITSPSTPITTTTIITKEPELPSPRPEPPSTITGRAQMLRRSQFHILLSIFDRVVLRTFKSRYTQFLVFWFTSLDPEFADLFQGMLVSKALLEVEQPTVTRAAAASYIGSFVSRALFVDAEGAKRVMGILCEFIRSHLDTTQSLLESGEPLLGSAENTVFYAICQAIFLIFCFRWRDLLDTPYEGEGDHLLNDIRPGKKWMPQMNVIQRALTSPLNPLKVCSSNVVAQFARVAQTTEFLYVYTIIDQNKRQEYTPHSSHTNSPGGVGHSLSHSIQTAQVALQDLNTFFPFDPYRLPKSAMFIEDVYREWSMVAIDNGEEEEDEDEDDEEEEEREERRGDVLGSLGIPTRQQSSSSPLDGSFAAMSISPMRPQISVGGAL